MGENKACFSFIFNRYKTYWKNILTEILFRIGVAARLFILAAATMFLTLSIKAQSSTYNFTTDAVLSFGTGGFNVWNTQADITIGGVAYRLTSGGNGSFTNVATGGVGNSKCLRKDGSGGDSFTLKRADGKPFQFYGLWVKHESMNFYPNVPPFYSISYSKADGDSESFTDNTSKQGGNYTASERTVTKNIAVTSVSINFNAIMYYLIDNIVVGPAVALDPSISTHPQNRTVCSESNTNFTIAASNASGYQWQVNAGAGFSNISNGGPYSGATSASLTVAASSAVNGYQYRCVINGSLTSNAATLTVNTVSLTSKSKVDVACNGGATGAASVNPPTDGVGPYTYDWTPGTPTGDGTASVTGLAAGTWVCTVTDANGCKASQTFIVTQPSALSATTSISNVSCNGGSDGSASVVASGGAGAYTYSWSPTGGSGTLISNLGVGTYSVTVTDANGCDKSAQAIITQPAKITASAAAQTICSGANTNVTLSSNTPGAVFAWTAAVLSGNVTGATAGSGNTIAQPLYGSGVVEYSIIPSVAGCTGTTTTTTVTVNASPSISGNPSGVQVEENESASFSVIANHGNGYQWQVNQGGGYVNVSNGEVYSGATQETLTIASSTESMNGYQYRCVVVGQCTPAAVSAAATLSVRLRATQVINFPSISAVSYGAADIIPGGSSDAGLTLSYTSSDESIASIVNGSIRIHRAGSVVITAAQSGDYDYKPAAPKTQTLQILPKKITASLSNNTPITKTYDGSNTASLTSSHYVLHDIETGDDVSVTGVATYSNASASSGKTVTATELTLQGADRNNYSLETLSAETTGDITQKGVVVLLNASPVISKTYDGSTNASLATANYSLQGVVGSDEVKVAGTAAYENKQAGEGKRITVSQFVLSGSDMDNYSLTNSTAETEGKIAKKAVALTLKSSPEITKEYNGTATAQLHADNYILVGTESGDNLTVAGIAAFDNRNAGEIKTVQVGSFELSGTDSDNYNLTTTVSTTSGSITPKSLTATLVNTVTKQYDGNTIAALASDNYLLNGIVGDDMVQLNNPLAGVYENKNGGNSKLITVAGIQIEGEDVGNYTLSSASISGAIGIITPKPIVVTADAQTKVYGTADPVFTYTADGKLAEDELAGSLEKAPGKNTGTYEILAGSLSGGDNYTIEVYNSANITITPAALLIRANDQTRKQGVENPLFTYTYEGLVGGDEAADLDTLPSSITAATKNSPIGDYDITVSGAVSENYDISYAKGKISVTPASSENYSVKSWSSSPDLLQVRIFTTTAQKAAIMLYTEVGQQVILQQKQLAVGNNSFTVQVGHLSASTYVLNVSAETFKDAQKVKVK